MTIAVCSPMCLYVFLSHCPANCASEWVDVAAPGYQIYAPSGRGAVSENLSEYRFVTGTSAAAAVVAGACALYMAACGHTSPDDMEAIVKRSTTSCKTRNASASGIINVAKMFDGDTTAPQIDVYAEEVEKVLKLGDSLNGKKIVL